MSKKQLEVVICRTCLRDNPGEGNTSDFEKNSKFYQEAFKEGWLKKSAQLKFQNCFAHCEKFHCIQVTQGGRGYLFKKISTPKVQGELVDWVRQCKSGGNLKEPEGLKDHIINPVQTVEKYQKI